jgi:hypothetical protein
MSWFNLKHYISETGMHLHQQVKPIMLGPIDVASPSLRMGPTDEAPPDDGERVQSLKDHVFN